jgi:hypothetical protein
MSTLSIRIPDSIHEIVKQISKDDNISINQFISSAITEKVTAMETENYLSQKGLLGNKKLFSNVLKKVPKINPDSFDE